MSSPTTPTTPPPRPGRRGSRRASHTASGSRTSVLPVLAVLVVAAVAVGLTRGGEPAPAATSRSSDDVVTRTVLSCPTEAADGAVTRVRLGLAPAPAGLGLPDTGTVRRGPVDAVAATVRLSRGDLVDVPRAGGPTVTGTAGAAAGLFGFRTDRRGGSGLAVTGCGVPRAQWWFTGAGAGLDHSSSLLLTNVDPGPAVVDLRVLGLDGEVRTVGTTGITLAPRSQRRIVLTDVAPQTDELALGVQASRGRVVASVSDSVRPPGAAAAGRDWVPGTDLPTRTVRLDGVPADVRGRTLLVGNPSDLEAVVGVRVSTRAAAFAPTGLGTITVAPGELRQVDLDRVLPAGEPVSLRLRSRVPVVASVRFGTEADHAYAGPAAPLTGPAAAPVPSGVRTSVQLTAGPRASAADVAAYDRSGTRVGGRRLSIPASATRTWSPPASSGYVVVTPSRGSVHGAVGYTGAGVADLPLTPLPIRVLRPSVRPAQSSGSGS
jgi:Family of unknown function (DUF5719)